MTYTYLANGLRLTSEIELPELMPFDGDGLISLQYGSVPRSLEGDVFRGALYQTGHGQYLLRVPGVAAYWIKDPRTVYIEPVPGARSEDVRVFILSSVMGVLAHYNGFLPLHASAIEIDGDCILFAGDSGSGKSTLAAAFHDRGHHVISDDICAISLTHEGRAVVHPGYRHLKLWGESLDRVGASLGERRELRAGMRKFSVHVPGEISRDPVPIRAIFALTTKLVDSIQIRKLAGREKMLLLRKDTYRYRLLQRVGHRGEHFRISKALGQSTPIMQVHRPLYISLLAELVGRLQQEADVFAQPA